MKSIKSIFVLLLVSFFTFVSCDNDGSSGGMYFYGTWDSSLMMGQGDLRDITTVKIDQSTVTMTFNKDGYYGYLYEHYGQSKTVYYTYNANDVDFAGEARESLTFDSPLYFVQLSSGKEFISKVFITKGPGGLVWYSADLSHGLFLSK